MVDGGIFALEKARVRRLGAVARRGMLPLARAEASRVIVDALIEAPWLGSASVVAGYVAQPDEVDLSRVWEWLRGRGQGVALPRWAPIGPALAFDHGTPRTVGPWGIEEPTGDLVEPSRVSVILVPGVAFDRLGARVGRGGGWYDRLLAFAPSAFRIGVAFERQIVAHVPQAAWDVPMDAIVTEAGTWTSESSSRREERELRSWMS